MRILHLFSNYKWTGPAEPAVNLAAALMRRGHDVLFASGKADDDVELRVHQHAAQRGLQIVHGLHLAKHLNVLADIVDMRRLRRIIQENDIEIVHTHLPNDHLVAALAARPLKNRPKLVRTFYDGEPLRWQMRNIYLLSKYTDASVFCSRKVRDAAVGRFLLDGSRATVIEGAVDLERFDPQRPLPDMRERFGLSPDHYVVGIVARVQKHRRFNVLLDMVERVSRELPDFRLVVIGRGTNREALAVEPVRQRGLDNIVIFTDYLAGDDYVGCLNALDAKIFLVPGSDGSCRAVREAMAMGLPVVAANRGMLPEIVEDSRTGRVVDDTAANLAAAIIELHDAQVRQSMAEAALARARRDFDRDRQAEKVEKIYEELVERQ